MVWSNAVCSMNACVERDIPQATTFGSAGSLFMKGWTVRWCCVFRYRPFACPDPVWPICLERLEGKSRARGIHHTLVLCGLVHGSFLRIGLSNPLQFDWYIRWISHRMTKSAFVNSNSTQVQYIYLYFHLAVFIYFFQSKEIGTLKSFNPFWEWSMSKFPCSLTRNMTSHSMENLTFHSLLRWKVIILQILATSLIQSLFERLGEYTFWAQEWKG